MDLKIEMVRPECILVNAHKKSFTFKKIDMKWFVLLTEDTVVRLLKKVDTLEDCFNYVFFFGGDNEPAKA